MVEGSKKTNFKVRAGFVAFTVFVMFFLQTFLIIDCNNVFSVYFSDWSKSMISLPVTVGGYIAIVVTFIIGSWLIRHKTTGMMFALLLITGICLIGLSFAANSYPLYCFCIILMNCTMSAILIVGTAICTNWFVTTRGRMLGFVTIGAPFSTAVMSPMIIRLLDVVSFKLVFSVFGVIVLVFAVFAVFLVPNRPEDIGLHADGALEETLADTDNGATAKWTLAKLVKCKEAWLIMMAFGLMMLVSNCVMPLLIPRFLEIGIKQSIALNLMTIAAVIGIPLSYLWGYIDDKCGTKKACIILAIGFTMMSIAMIFSSSGNMVIVALAILGIACVTGGSPNLNPSLISNVFGASEYLNVNRYLFMGQTILRLMALVMMNAIYDTMGSYTPGYVVCLILSIAALCCFLGIKKRYSEAKN